MPKSATRTPSGEGPAGQAVGHLDPEAVVAEEDVADAGDEDRVDRSPGRRADRRPAPRPRRGGRTGSGRCHSNSSVAGSSSRVTATCSAPSTSLEHAGDRGRTAGEEEVVGVGPPRGVQANRRALPDLDPADPRGVGPGVDAGVDRWLPPRQRRLGGSASSGLGRRTDRADRAVQALPDLGRHVVAPVDDRGGAAVGAARLGLLLVGERQHAQGEDLVDLGRVAEVARRSRARPPGGRRG